MYVSVKIDADEMVNALVSRVSVWNEDEDVLALYEKMYENYVYGGCFDESEFDVMAIVDNDYVNWCDVICKGEEYYDEIKQHYDEDGLGDCGICSIEAEHNGMFLIRW